MRYRTVRDSISTTLSTQILNIVYVSLLWLFSRGVFIPIKFFFLNYFIQCKFLNRWTWAYFCRLSQFKHSGHSFLSMNSYHESWRIPLDRDRSIPETWCSRENRTKPRRTPMRRPFLYGHAIGWIVVWWRHPRARSMEPHSLESAWDRICRYINRKTCARC